MPDLQYPVGKFEWSGPATPEQRKRLIAEIEAAPAKLRAAVKGLSAKQLDAPYRPGGWTSRQVIHHVPDSHLNAYVRFKLALTEDQPTIKPYDQDRWANLADARETPIEVSLALLESVHARWVTILRSLSAEDFARTFRHPEYDVPQTLDRTLALYAWHGAHHTAHITSLRDRMGWNARKRPAKSKPVRRTAKGRKKR
jgi:uncharacterized damage-inducible protein DinB